MHSSSFTQRTAASMMRTSSPSGKTIFFRSAFACCMSSSSNFMIRAKKYHTTALKSALRKGSSVCYFAILKYNEGNSTREEQNENSNRVVSCSFDGRWNYVG